MTKPLTGKCGRCGKDNLVTAAAEKRYWCDECVKTPISESGDSPRSAGPTREAAKFASWNTGDVESGMSDSHGNAIPSDAAAEILFWRNYHASVLAQKEYDPRTSGQRWLQRRGFANHTRTYSTAELGTLLEEFWKEVKAIQARDVEAQLPTEKK
jgi:hypothetical protein